MATALEALRWCISIDGRQCLCLAVVAGGEQLRLQDGLITQTTNRNPETIHPSKLLWGLSATAASSVGMVRVALSRDNSDLGAAGLSVRPATGQWRWSTSTWGKDGECQAPGAAGRRAGAAGPVDPYVTSDRDGDDLRQYPPVPDGEALQIPARSVVTLVGELAP